MEQKTMTQTECVYEYMRTEGSITQLDAMRDLGVMRLASRISDLRKKGIKVESIREAVKTRYGGTTYIKRYRLAKTEKPEWEERMLRTFLGSRANEGENNVR